MEFLFTCGERRTQYTRRLVGSGTGPATVAPVCAAVSTIFLHDSVRLRCSNDFSLMRIFCDGSGAVCGADRRKVGHDMSTRSAPRDSLARDSARANYSTRDSRAQSCAKAARGRTAVATADCATRERCTRAACCVES